MTKIHYGSPNDPASDHWRDKIFVNTHLKLLIPHLLRGAPFYSYISFILNGDFSFIRFKCHEVYFI